MNVCVECLSLRELESFERDSGISAGIGRFGVLVGDIGR